MSEIIIAIIAGLVGLAFGLIYIRFVTTRIDEIEKSNHKVHGYVDHLKNAMNENTARMNENFMEINKAVELEGRILQERKDSEDEIIRRMENVVNKLRELEADEKEIRRYYINFREPGEWDEVIDG